MKTVVILSILLCAASAAPTEVEEQAPEAAVVAAKEELAAPLEMEEKVMTEDDGDEDSAPVSENVHANICPDGWFHYGSHCFIFVNSPMNWYSAEEHCNRLGANLASVSSPKEYSFLQQIAQTGSQTVVWLGGFNLQGRWMWINRDGFYYTNWYTPSSSSAYACIYLRTTNGWGSCPCTTVYRFICSKNAFGCKMHKKHHHRVLP